MAPKVCVIIPSYNHAHFLPFALESVLAQTYLEWEAVVVDDGSTDGTPSVVSRFKDARICYVYQENSGLSAARNTGIRNAQAELIALLDADDLWEPTFLEEMVPLLEGHPEAAAVYCGFRYVDEAGLLVGDPRLRVVPSEDFYKTVFTYGNWLVPCSVVFRKQAAVELGCFDESMQALEDTDLWLRMSSRYAFIGLRKALVRYRRHGSNMSNNAARMVTAHHQLAEKHYGPATGEVASWPTMKREGYARLYRSATRHYLRAGDLNTSAGYFEKLVGVLPENASSIQTWRSFARVHLPAENRGEFSIMDWEPAQQSVQSLLETLQTRAQGSPALKKALPRVKAGAMVALAQEAAFADDLPRTLDWLKRAAQMSYTTFFLKPFWGTLARSLIKLGGFRRSKSEA